MDHDQGVDVTIPIAHPAARRHKPHSSVSFLVFHRATSRSAKDKEVRLSPTSRATVVSMFNWRHSGVTAAAAQSSSYYCQLLRFYVDLID